MSIDSFVADPEMLMAEEQAAELINMPVRTLQNWRLRGGGPRYAKLGRRVRYRRRDLIEWVEGNLASSTSDAGAGK